MKLQVVILYVALVVATCKKSENSDPPPPAGADQTTPTDRNNIPSTEVPTDTTTTTTSTPTPNPAPTPTPTPNPNPPTTTAQIWFRISCLVNNAVQEMQTDTTANIPSMIVPRGTSCLIRWYSTYLTGCYMDGGTTPNGKMSVPPASGNEHAYYVQVNETRGWGFACDGSPKLNLISGNN